ncbi:synaptosomal-associated protein 23-like isoform X2 [Octodon degus]|uniref:Synaptosomal-associated protein 23 n=1 Tax=Octodon degus TaxID=10160 RepID=A0A6P3FDP7_OCTDE|nr:synaptosomal-associated protein 23-like isoform X2 [Octodon degus]
MDHLSPEDIQLRANQLTDESLESTRKMLDLAVQSEDAGIQTITMLGEQGEQLNCIVEGMDQINKDIRETEKTLTEFNKCCGLCVCLCSRTKNFECIKQITTDAREEEMQENLTQVGSILGNLKKMASDMGNKIEVQNRQIDAITKKVDTSKDHIDVANTEAKKLIDS